jgi:hypothetical protein
MEALGFRFPSNFGVVSPNYQITSRVITANKEGVKHSIGAKLTACHLRLFGSEQMSIDDNSFWFFALP